MVISPPMKVIDLVLIIMIKNGYLKKKKVILLGDSFVHGACVFRKDSIAGLLQNLNEIQKFIIWHIVNTDL